MSSQPTSSWGVLLQNSKDEVIRRWLSRLKDEIPQTREETKYALIDSLPDFIDQIVSVLDGHAPTEHACYHICAEHGEQRTRMKSFNMEQVVHEYQILRNCLIFVLEKNGQPLPSVIRDAILDIVDLAIRLVSQVFIDKDLEMAHEERGLRTLFVASVAHDLANPLNIIKMSAEFIHEEITDPKAVAEHAERILQRSNTMLNMIYDLLDTELIRAGKKVSLKLESVNLSDLLEELINDKILQHGRRFKLNLTGPQPITGTWDRNRVSRIIENLVSNAIKYGKKEGLISLSAFLKDQLVTIKVHNEGEAIPPSEQKKLFRPFYRTDSKNNGNGHTEGWGIGLSFVVGMARAHGGSAHVQSLPGEGTTFSIVLPQHAGPLPLPLPK